jgi:hypothetical protein
VTVAGAGGISVADVSRFVPLEIGVAADAILSRVE